MAKSIQNQSGQSLIETIGAIFILTMALTTALGLAVYALSRSAISQQEIIATNLAREGIDVVRAMRDSNWLASDTKGASWALSSCSDIGDKLCYPKVYMKVPPINEYDLTAGNFRPNFDTNSETWTLNTNGDYDLYLQIGGTYSANPVGSSVYARMINIGFNQISPCAPSCSDANKEMVIKSVVAWRGKNCASFNPTDDLLTVNSSCKIVTEEHLTNWKDYR